MLQKPVADERKACFVYALLYWNAISEIIFEKNWLKKRCWNTKFSCKNKPSMID